MTTDLPHAADGSAPASPGRPPTVRAATPADAHQISLLRSEFVLSRPLDLAWVAQCAAELAPRLGAEGDARAFVIDAPDGMLAACALGLVQPVLPAPTYPRGLAARVHVVATHPDHRRRGYARLVVTALLDHLTADGVTLFDLHSTPEARPLYEELGFRGMRQLMRMTRLDPALAPPAPEGPFRMPLEEYAETVEHATGFACVYFTDEAGHPLQVHATYSTGHPWQLVGGTMDVGERPFETAVRECREEIGLAMAGPPRLLATIYGGPGGGWPYPTFGTVFDGGTLTAEQIRGLVLDPREHDEVRVLPLQEWKPLMPERDFARLYAITEARRTGTAAYFDTWDWGTS
ncbi:GNAT family N-acetyltransferase [Streptomyces globisporus]|uniref:bifunctional GNAT family N-acetyltransferase/NUDIX hydrolase n=1 Tax=Streptomyces globisporus TaxID=1908 RepID=UPI0036DF85F1